MRYLFGSQNFGFATEDSDKDYYLFRLPTAKELCEKTMLSAEVKNEDGSVTKVKDVRLAPDLFNKANVDVLQLLYSVDKSPSDFNSFLEKNEYELSTMNLQYLFKSAVGTCLQRLKNPTVKSMVHCLFQLDLLQYVANGGTMRAFFSNARNLPTYLDYRKGMSVESLTELVNYKLNSVLELKEFYYSCDPNVELYNRFKDFCGTLAAKSALGEYSL